jgi:hypothetical protein
MHISKEKKIERYKIERSQSFSVGRFPERSRRKRDTRIESERGLRSNEIIRRTVWDHRMERLLQNSKRTTKRTSFDFPTSMTNPKDLSPIVIKILDELSEKYFIHKPPNIRRSDNLKLGWRNS